MFPALPAGWILHIPEAVGIAFLQELPVVCVNRGRGSPRFLIVSSQWKSFAEYGI